MAFKPSQITKQNILDAIDKIEQENIDLKKATRWQVIINKKTYPPKEVMRLAHQQMNGEKIWEYGGGEGTNKFLKKFGFEMIDMHENSIKSLIIEYKKHIQVTHLNDEKYKWELLEKFKRKPNLDAPDLLEEFKGIKYTNLIYPIAITVLFQLIGAKSEEMRILFKKLFDEDSDLTERIKSFNAESLLLYRNLGETLQHHQDERTIATYLTFYNPEKYTFYKYSFYKKLCVLLNESEAKKNEKYPHYLQLINRIIDEYVQEDNELIDMVKNYIPDYYDGSSHLLLTQDILYQMLDKKQGSKDINVKNEFIDWLIENKNGGNYFKNQFNSDEERIANELTSYEEKYRSEFNAELFIVEEENYENHIEQVRLNIYDASSSFNKYSKDHYSGRPTAILGNKQYLSFLKERVQHNESNSITETYNEENMNAPLNQILYGPPGTGKTYHTVLEASKIVTGNEFITYDEALNVFNENLGTQIEFITFHQNYSYEDFIQGLRPDTGNGTALTFEKKDGVFKRIADRAYKNLQASKNPAAAKKDFDIVFQELIKPLNEGDIEELEIKMKKSNFYITEIGEKSIEFRKNIGESQHTLSINTLRRMYDNGVNDIIFGGLQPYYNPILALLLEKGKSALLPIEQKNYVIIIDEINRANISRVFGELITLIEEDKRSHSKIPMRVTLPSGDSFIVPSNLYLIGTMNTADKSIALLDIALRRRFEFVPMYPDATLDTVHDKEILTDINTAILKRKSYDFTIGHAYFMGEHYNREKTINNKVIPLLLEYFMNDEKEVIAILGEAKLTVGSWPLKLL